MSILDTIRHDTADQLHVLHYDYYGSCGTPGTLEHVTTTAWSADATDTTAQQAAAEFIRHNRDHIIWPRSARFGLLLSSLDNLDEFQADRDAWRESSDGEEVADYVVRYRRWQRFGDALPEIAQSPDVIVRTIMGGLGMRSPRYNVSALVEDFYEVTDGGTYRLAVARDQAGPLLVRYVTGAPEGIYS